MAKQLQQDKLKIVNEYAWKWFSFHAEQRMKVFSFYFVVMAALTAAYYQTYNKPLIALTFTILGLVFSFTFWRLDLRNQELIKIGESLLLEMEAEMRRWGIAHVRLVGAANLAAKKPKPWYVRFAYTYGQVFSLMFLVIALVSLSGAVLLIYNILCPPTV